MTKYILTITLSFFALLVFGQVSDSTKKVNQIITAKSDSLDISINLTDIDRIEKLLIKNAPSWVTTYGTLAVAFLALFGAVLTAILNNRRSRINTEKQINAAAENINSQLTTSNTNLIAQIQATGDLEKEKKKLELAFKLKTELKENVAKFIQKATVLNGKLTTIIYSDIEEGRMAEAIEEYSKTFTLRHELRDIYYSIKVTLDGSDKQIQLERVLDNYMNTVDFDFDIDNTPKKENYQQPIGQLYHKIKSIFHDNYQEPV
jgi:hypothetical protein